MSVNRKYTFSTFLSNNKSSVNPSFYIQPSINNIDSYVVTNFTGINNIYTIDARNCNIQILETGQVAFTAVLPTGNYTIATLLTALKTALDAYTYTDSIYTVSKSDLTNRITITNSNKTFVIQDTVNNCYYELGFLTFNSASLTQTASNQYDLSGLKTLHIVSNDLGNDGSYLINSNYNILCSIPIDDPYLGVINYESGSDHLINCKMNELSSITFVLMDERFRILQSVSDWSLQLVCNFN